MFYKEEKVITYFFKLLYIGMSLFMTFFAWLAVAVFSVSILLILPSLLAGQKKDEGETVKPKRKWLLISSSVGLVLQGIFTVNLLLSAPEGVSISLLNIVVLVSFLTTLLVTLAMSHLNTLWFLLPIVFGFNILTLAANILIPHATEVYLRDNIGLFFHIGVALLAYATCLIATLYALRIFWLDRNLKQKKIILSPVIPPIMVVERQFYKILFVGEGLLTLTLLSGALYFEEFFSVQQAGKAVFTLLAWIIFAILLFAIKKLHWRGKKVIIYALSGMIALSLAYFASVRFGFMV